MKKTWQALVTFVLVLLLTLTTSFLGIAQTENPETVSQAGSTQKTAAEQIDGFPVVLDGDTIFVIRRGFGSFSAQERATAITKRLEKIAQDSSISLEKITINTEREYNLVDLSLDGQIILTITPQDAKDYRTTQAELAKTARQKIIVALEQYRQSRQPKQLLQGVIYTLVASFILLLVSVSILKISGKIFPASKNWIETQIPGLRIQNFEIISSERISNLCLRLMQLVRLFVFLIILYVYITFVFSLFPWTKPFSQSILGYLLESLDFILKSIGQYIPNIFSIVLIVIITHYIIRLIRPFFTAIERGTIVIPGFYQDWAVPTYNILLFLIIALAAVVAFPYLPGFDSPAFRGISVFLGLLLSLGSTAAVANVVGGIILIYTRAFQVGDLVQITDIVGVVIEKTLLVVRLCTFTNKVITIPNSSLLNSNVINYSVASRELQRPLMLQTTITLGYDLPWRKVHATLREAALATEHILKEPAPFVFQTSLDDFYVSYQLNAYTDQPTLFFKISSELHQNIQDKCNEVGIEIMSPHYASLRDGNQTTIPENYLPSDYVPPPFRVQG